MNTTNLNLRTSPEVFFLCMEKLYCLYLGIFVSPSVPGSWVISGWLHRSDSGEYGGSVQKNIGGGASFSRVPKAALSYVLEGYSSQFSCGYSMKCLRDGVLLILLVDLSALG